MSEQKHIVMLLDNTFESDARVEKECESLHDKGYTITLYATNENPLINQIEKRSYVKIIRLFEHIIHQPLNKNYKEKINFYAKEICATPFDIIHCHDYKTLVIGKEIKKIKENTKLVYDSHEFLVGWPWYKEIKSIKGKIKGRFVWLKFKKLEREAIKYTNSIITVSETLADEMKKEFKLEIKPKVIRNIPKKIQIEQNNYFRDLYQLDERSTLIVHSGNIYYDDKRLNKLINAIKQLEKENIHLIFIGDSLKLKKLSEDIKEKNIHFHYYPKRNELFRIIQSADFGLVYTWQPNLKSHWFSLPNRLFEYTLAQLPILSTSQPEFQKISDAYRHLQLFKGDDEKELTNAIRKIKDNKNFLKEMAILASQKFSWEKEMETLVDIYEENSHGQ